MLVLFWATGWSGGGANLGCMCNLLEVAEHKVNSGAASYRFSSDDLDEDGVTYQTGP